MTNQYRALHPSYVAQYGEEVVDLDLSAAEERDHLNRGFLEIAPRPYRVLIDHYTIDGHPVDQGAVVELALPAENEAGLIAGGVLERTRRDASPTVDVEELGDEPANPESSDPEPDPPKPKRRPRRTESE